MMMGQVTDKELVRLLRKKVELRQPYAGVFLKKDDRCVLQKKKKSQLVEILPVTGENWKS